MSTEHLLCRVRGKRGQRIKDGDKEKKEILTKDSMAFKRENVNIKIANIQNF